jgi:hypothetical protein
MSRRGTEDSTGNRKQRHRGRWRRRRRRRERDWRRREHHRSDGARSWVRHKLHWLEEVGERRREKRKR